MYLTRGIIVSQLSRKSQFLAGDDFAEIPRNGMDVNAGGGVIS